jgi:endonuclease YncB( thermonuclease family)
MQKPSLAPYDTLRHNIVAVLADARERAHRLVERELARAYLEVGRLLDAHLQENSQRAQYGQEVFKQLANDLDIPRRRLYEMLQVYRALEKVRTSAQLSWSHYLTLAKAPAEQRCHYAARAAKEGLSVRQLQEIIGSGASLFTQELRAKVPTLRAQRGVLYTYRLVESLSPAGKTELALDLGFSLRRICDLKDIEKPQVGQVLTSARKGRGYTFTRTERATQQLFAFVAVVERVVDGDTLLVEVDCGFGSRIKQRLRLRGIDAPELKTAAGRRARAFIKSELAALDFVVVKTFRPDKYDRYLADVFFLPGAEDAQQVAAEGIFLNGLLVKKGLAQIFV